MNNSTNSTLVYSSETGLVKQPASGKPDKGRSKTAPAPSPPADGTVRLQRQTKGRGGGTVVVITGVPLAGAELKNLAGELKKRCGCGGTVKDGVIEIQGDHRDTILAALQAKGYRVKLAGG